MSLQMAIFHFLWLNNLLYICVGGAYVCVCVCIFLYNIVYIHSSIDGHLGYFHVLNIESTHMFLIHF